VDDFRFRDRDAGPDLPYRRFDDPGARSVGGLFGLAALVVGGLTALAGGVIDLIGAAWRRLRRRDGGG
jgi:hypothetical protein